MRGRWRKGCSCCVLCLGRLAQVVKEYMLVAEIIIKSSVDPTIKKITEKLYYKSKDLIEKNSLKEYYSEQVESLQVNLREKLEAIRRLDAENKTLKLELKGESESALKLPAIDSAKNASRNETGRNTKSSFNTATELTSKFSPLLSLFHLFTSDKDLESLKQSIADSYKDLVGCSCAMAVERGVERLYEGVLFENKVRFYKLDKHFASKVPTVNNAVLAEDEIYHCVKVAVSYKVSNYMVVPCRSSKDKPVSKIIVFINKKDEKGGLVNFGKLDEIIAQIGCSTAHKILKHHKLLSRFNTFKNVKQLLYDSLYDLVAYVLFPLML